MPHVLMCMIQRSVFSTCLPPEITQNEKCSNKLFSCAKRLFFLRKMTLLLRKMTLFFIGCRIIIIGLVRFGFTLICVSPNECGFGVI